MHLNLNSKKVLITGASRGIGLAIAESFLQEDAKTCLVSRGSNALFKNEKKLQNDFGLKNIFAYKCDCTNIESLNSLKDEIGNRWGDLDVVVVNVAMGEVCQMPCLIMSNGNKHGIVILNLPYRRQEFFCQC